MNENLTTNGFERDWNYQILSYILKVIAPASQHPNLDWKWTVDGQTLNWGVKWWWNFTILLSTESWWNKESNETRIKWFKLKIKEKSLFLNQKKSKPNLGENEEQIDLKDEINYLNLI